VSRNTGSRRKNPEALPAQKVCRLLSQHREELQYVLSEEKAEELSRNIMCEVRKLLEKQVKPDKEKQTDSSECKNSDRN